MIKIKLIIIYSKEIIRWQITNQKINSFFKLILIKNYKMLIQNTLLKTKIKIQIITKIIIINVRMINKIRYYVKLVIIYY